MQFSEMGSFTSDRSRAAQGLQHRSINMCWYVGSFLIILPGGDDGGMVELNNANSPVKLRA
jgi:hypothetical protein